MAYVIVGTCINDAACVDVCPVDCILPRPNDPGFREADMLAIDPAVCIDCNACAEACPVNAIYSEHRLPEALQRYRAINAQLTGRATA